jgi:hypothetical protein
MHYWRFNSSRMWGWIDVCIWVCLRVGVHFLNSVELLLTEDEDTLRLRNFGNYAQQWHRFAFQKNCIFSNVLPEHQISHVSEFWTLNLAVDKKKGFNTHFSIQVSCSHDSPSGICFYVVHGGITVRSTFLAHSVRMKPIFKDYRGLSAMGLVKWTINAVFV